MKNKGDFGKEFPTLWKREQFETEWDDAILGEGQIFLGWSQDDVQDCCLDKEIVKKILREMVSEVKERLAHRESAKHQRLDELIIVYARIFQITNYEAAKELGLDKEEPLKSLYETHERLCE